MERLLTSREAADILRIHYDTLTRMVREGSGPSHIRLGRKLLFREEALREFLNKREVI